MLSLTNSQVSNSGHNNSDFSINNVDILAIFLVLRNNNNK